MMSGEKVRVLNLCLRIVKFFYPVLRREWLRGVAFRLPVVLVVRDICCYTWHAKFLADWNKMLQGVGVVR